MGVIDIYCNSFKSLALTPYRVVVTVTYRISSNKCPGAYFKFQLKGGRLLEEGRLIEGALIKFSFQRTVLYFG